jgi:ABC-type taurine transport system ATPase subunit
LVKKSEITQEESDKSLEAAIYAKRVTKTFGVGKDKVLALNDVTSHTCRSDQISGGQQQRVALARALAPKPQERLLFLTSSKRPVFSFQRVPKRPTIFTLPSGQN